MPSVLIGGEAALHQQRKFRDRRLDPASLLSGGVGARGRPRRQVFVLNSRVLIADRQTGGGGGSSAEGRSGLPEDFRLSAVIL